MILFISEISGIEMFGNINLYPLQLKLNTCAYKYRCNSANDDEIFRCKYVYADSMTLFNILKDIYIIAHSFEVYDMIKFKLY